MSGRVLSSSSRVGCAASPSSWAGPTRSCGATTDGSEGHPVAEPSTYVACLTPPGTAAIATLALRGPRAWDVVRQLFQPLSPSGQPLPAEPQPGRVWLGRLGEGLSDQVVVTVKRPVAA